MSGEIDLGKLLSSLETEMHKDVFVFATIASGVMPAGLTPQMAFTEAEGLSLILTKDQAAAHSLPYEYESKMITLNIHSSLEAVGFMAHISALLADAGISVNPVAGFYHDHLFVPVAKADAACQILRKISS